MNWSKPMTRGPPPNHIRGPAPLQQFNPRVGPNQIRGPAHAVPSSSPRGPPGPHSFNSGQMFGLGNQQMIRGPPPRLQGQQQSRHQAGSQNNMKNFNHRHGSGVMNNESPGAQVHMGDFNPGNNASVNAVFQSNPGPDFSNRQNSNFVNCQSSQNFQHGHENMGQRNSFFNGPRHGNIPGPRGFNAVNGPRPGPRPRFSSPPNFSRSPGPSGPRFQQHPGKKKKQRPDKRDLPENNKFYCETCDRGYKDEDKYKLHLDTHEQCPKEGCKYVAAAKLVQLHINMHHRTGLAKKIWSLESKEDIQKWREERKRNYPTADNIEKKKALLADKIARGECIEEKYFGKMHRRGDTPRGRGRRGNWRQRGRQHSETDVQQDSTGPVKAELKRKTEDPPESCEDKKKPKLSEGTDSLGVFFKSADSADSSSSSSDSSDSEQGDSKNKKGTGEPGSTSAVPIAAGALGSLMTSYLGSSSSDDDEDKNEDEKIIDKRTETKSSENTSVDKEKSQTCDSNNTSDRKPRRRRQRKKPGGQKTTLALPHWSTRVDKSLLEKLLSKDIRRERNQILQCVHYIVQHNFFDKNHTNTEINGNVQ